MIRMNTAVWRRNSRYLQSTCLLSCFSSQRSSSVMHVCQNEKPYSKQCSSYLMDCVLKWPADTCSLQWRRDGGGTTRLSEHPEHRRVTNHQVSIWINLDLKCDEFTQIKPGTVSMRFLAPTDLDSQCRSLFRILLCWSWPVNCRTLTRHLSYQTYLLCFGVSLLKCVTVWGHIITCCVINAEINTRLTLITEEWVMSVFVCEYSVV